MEARGDRVALVVRFTFRKQVKHFNCQSFEARQRDQEGDAKGQKLGMQPPFTKKYFLVINRYLLFINKFSIFGT